MEFYFVWCLPLNNLQLIQWFQVANHAEVSITDKNIWLQKQWLIPDFCATKVSQVLPRYICIMQWTVSRTNVRLIMILTSFIAISNLPAGVEVWADGADGGGTAVESVTCCCVVFSVAGTGVLESGFCVVGSTSFAVDVISCVGAVCSYKITPISSYMCCNLLVMGEHIISYHFTNLSHPWQYNTHKTDDWEWVRIFTWQYGFIRFQFFMSLIG